MNILATRIRHIQSFRNQFFNRFMEDKYVSRYSVCNRLCGLNLFLIFLLIFYKHEATEEQINSTLPPRKIQPILYQ